MDNITRYSQIKHEDFFPSLISYDDDKIKLAEFNTLFQALLAAKASGPKNPGVADTITQFHLAESIIFPERKIKGKLKHQGYFSDYTVVA